VFGTCSLLSVISPLSLFVSPFASRPLYLFINLVHSFHSSSLHFRFMRTQTLRFAWSRWRSLVDLHSRVRQLPLPGAGAVAAAVAAAADPSFSSSSSSVDTALPSTATATAAATAAAAAAASSSYSSPYFSSSSSLSSSFPTPTDGTCATQVAAEPVVIDAAQSANTDDIPDGVPDGGDDDSDGGDDDTDDVNMDRWRVAGLWARRKIISRAWRAWRDDAWRTRQYDRVLFGRECN
jgi:hypothetical protein